MTIKLPLTKDFDKEGTGVLSRGYDYYINKQVSNLTVEGNVISAAVRGTSKYSVKVKIENNRLVKWVCDCPYDGSFCKHIAALIYYIQENGILDKTGNSEKQPKKKKDEKIEYLLSKLSHSELAGFTANLIYASDKIRNAFLRKFDSSREVKPIKYYAEKTEALITSAADDGDYIEESAAWAIGEAFEEYLKEAEFQIKEGNTIGGLNICFGVFETLIKNDEEYHDGEGVISWPDVNPFAPLGKINYAALSKTERDSIFNLALGYIGGDLKNYSGWISELLRLAEKLTDSTEKTDKLVMVLESGGGIAGLDKQDIALLLGLFEKYKSNDFISDFIGKNMGNDDIRETAVEMALEKKDYSSAIKIIQERINNESKRYFDSNRWYEILLAIALQIDDNNLIVFCAEFLFFNSYKNEKEYFDLIKQRLPKDDLEKFIDNITAKVVSERADFNKIPRTYIYTERWDKLFDYIKKYPSLDELINHHKYLLNDYYDEVIRMFSEMLRKFAQENMGVENYEFIYKVLSVMLKAGARDEVKALKDEFLVLYKRRPRLVEQLSRIKV